MNLSCCTHEQQIFETVKSITQRTGSTQPLPLEHGQNTSVCSNTNNATSTLSSSWQHGSDLNARRHARPNPLSTRLPFSQPFKTASQIHRTCQQRKSTHRDTVWPQRSSKPQFSTCFRLQRWTSLFTTVARCDLHLRAVATN